MNCKPRLCWGLSLNLLAFVPITTNSSSFVEGSFSSFNTALVEGLNMTKTERLDAMLDEQDLNAVWFAQPNNFGWLTGANNVVARGGPGVAAAGYDGHSVTVATNNIEAERFLNEVTPDIDLIEASWHENSLADIVREGSPRPAGADFDIPGFESIDLSAFRQPLTQDDIDRYQGLSIEVAEVLESVAKKLQPDTTELWTAGRLRGELAERGINSPVVLVGGSERASIYRHYVPTNVPIGAYALLSVTAERNGLHTSATRTVAFDPPVWLEERTLSAMRVEATALAATQEVGRSGGEATEVFSAIKDAYTAVGWTGEWHEHLQGGAAGYAGREWMVTPTLKRTVKLPMGYAYNPTVQGAKSEDTALVTAERIEILSATGDWPTWEVEAVGYDWSMECPAIRG